jgi:hypothetical protein
VPPAVAWTLTRFYKYYHARCGNSTAVCSALRCSLRAPRCENKINYDIARRVLCMAPMSMDLPYCMGSKFTKI